MVDMSTSLSGCVDISPAANLVPDSGSGSPDGDALSRWEIGCTVNGKQSTLHVVEILG